MSKYKMRNICFFNTVKFWGGGEKLHLDHAHYFAQQGYKVWILCRPESALSKKLEAENLFIFPMRIYPGGFINPFNLIHVYLFLNNHAIDTIIFSTSTDAKLGGLAALLAGIKNRIYMRGLASSIKGHLLNRFFYKNVFTGIVANSLATKSEILRNMSSVIPFEKVKVIYHGININEEYQSSTIEAMIQAKSKGIVLGYAGRLTKQKGPLDLIEISMQLKQKKIPFTLFIAGTGELYEVLNNTIIQKELQDVIRLLGFVENIDAFMQSLDVFLLTSHWEGFGFVIVEAMQKAKPVIAWNISSSPELIDNEISGFLINPFNISEFAEKVNVLSENKELRKAMGLKAKEVVNKRFNAQDRMKEFEDYLLHQH